LAYNLGNFMRTLTMPKTAEAWSMTSLREKLIKIGAKVVSHDRYVTFQMAEVAVPLRKSCRSSPGYRRPPLRHDGGGVGRGVPGMKQSHEFRTCEASNPNDWLRTRLVAPELHCSVPR
jgi:hypothetical protein